MSPDAGQHAGVTDTQETENEIMPRCARSPGVATPDLRAVNFKPHGRSHHEAGDGANVGSRETSKSDNETQEQAEDACNRDCRFWCVILALCTMQILCSVENMVAVTRCAPLSTNWAWAAVTSGSRIYSSWLSEHLIPTPAAILEKNWTGC